MNEAKSWTYWDDHLPVAHLGMLDYQNYKNNSSSNDDDDNKVASILNPTSSDFSFPSSMLLHQFFIIEREHSLKLGACMWFPFPLS